MTSPHRSPSPDPTFAHRVAEATVTVRGADGAPLADTEVVVEQTRHAFAFGNIGFDFIGYANGESHAAPDSPFGGAGPELGDRLAELYLDLYNTTTLPFYWGGFEPERGKPDTTRLLRTAQWFTEHGITVKGHPLVWHTVTADWLRDLPVDQI
uniref:endo-1,4-beta-xylanase n=1 Tax=uncultured Cellulomonas sp. TaxID=189682 RepID=UPI0026119CC1